MYCNIFLKKKKIPDLDAKKRFFFFTNFLKMDDNAPVKVNPVGGGIGI